MAQIDVFIRDHGSVVSFFPISAQAKVWFDENVESEGWQWQGKALVVDHRPARDLILGIINDTDLITN